MGLAILLLTARAWTSMEFYERHFGVPVYDWQFYSQAVERWLSGNAIYPGARISTLVTPAGGSYSYPPASVPLMVPFASYPAGAVLWEALIVAVLLSGIWAVVRVGWPERSLRAFAVTLIALAFFPPALEGLAVANINVATAGALGWMWAGSRLSGGAPAVLAIMKVFPFALAVPQGRRVVATTAVAVIAACAITLPLVGLGAWADYVNGLRASAPLCGDPAHSNWSLACALQPTVGPDAAKWAGLVIAAALLPIAYAAGRSVIGVAAVVAAIMLPATELHGHYFTLVFMLLLVIGAELTQRRAVRLHHRLT